MKALKPFYDFHLVFFFSGKLSLAIKHLNGFSFKALFCTSGVAKANKKLVLNQELTLSVPRQPVMSHYFFVFVVSIFIQLCFNFFSLLKFCMYILLDFYGNPHCNAVFLWKQIIEMIVQSTSHTQQPFSKIFQCLLNTKSVVQKY